MAKPGQHLEPARSLRGPSGRYLYQYLYTAPVGSSWLGRSRVPGSPPTLAARFGAGGLQGWGAGVRDKSFPEQSLGGGTARLLPPFVPLAAPRMLGELWLSSPRWCQPRPPSWHRRCPKSVLPSGSRAGWQQRGRGSHFLLCRQPGSGHGAAPPLGFWSSMSSSQGKAARPQSLEAAPGLGAFSPPCFARRAGGKLCAARWVSLSPSWQAGGDKIGGYQPCCAPGSPKIKRMAHSLGENQIGFAMGKQGIASKRKN